MPDNVCDCCFSEIWLLHGVCLKPPIMASDDIHDWCNRNFNLTLEGKLQSVWEVEGIFCYLAAFQDVKYKWIVHVIPLFVSDHKTNLIVLGCVFFNSTFIAIKFYGAPASEPPGVGWSCGPTCQSGPGLNGSADVIYRKLRRTCKLDVVIVKGNELLTGYHLSWCIVTGGVTHIRVAKKLTVRARALNSR